MEVGFGFGLVFNSPGRCQSGILLRDNFVTQTNHNSVTIPPLVSVSYFLNWVGGRAQFHMERVGGAGCRNPCLQSLAEIRAAIMPSKCQLR